MTNNRTDCHRPSALVPADYRRVLSFAFAGSGLFPECLAYNIDVLTEMRRTLPFFKKASGKGGCDVCGAHFRFGDVFEHIPTGQHIITGWECAEQIEHQADRSEFERAYAGAKEQALAAMKRQEKATQRAEFLAANPGLENALASDHRILADLAERLQKWGNLSEGQVKLALKIAAELNAPEKPKGQVPQSEERIQVAGRVVSIKAHSSDYGTVNKVLVKVETAAGAYRLFGKLPSQVWDAKRDDQITFSAKVERSDRDLSFGFFSRPTKAAFLSRAGTEPTP